MESNHESKLSLALGSSLNLSEVVSTGSVLQISADWDDVNTVEEAETTPSNTKNLIMKPVECFSNLEKHMTAVDEEGLVKKSIIEEGGGLPLHKGCTVHIAFAGYWENDSEPFDLRMPSKPMVVDLNDNGLLPGLVTAVNSMLVGETSTFLLSYKVMYGELGIPPRIKPKADCVFYIKLMKSTLTQDEKLDLAEPNMFTKALYEVKKLYGSGVTMYKTNNHTIAISLFRKGVFMLQRCRLADEEEEQKQEKMLKKLYTNLAVCYNAIRMPLKACIACNELNRLNSLYNNGKALFHNARALRMIGEFDLAEQKLKRAHKLCPDKKGFEEEYELLNKMRESCDRSKLFVKKNIEQALDSVSKSFRGEVDKLINNFKQNDECCKLKLPQGLSKDELNYIKEACIRENLFFNQIREDFALDKEESKDLAKDYTEYENTNTVL